MKFDGILWALLAATIVALLLNRYFQAIIFGGKTTIPDYHYIPYVQPAPVYNTGSPMMWPSSYKASSTPRVRKCYKFVLEVYCINN